MFVRQSSRGATQVFRVWFTDGEPDGLTYAKIVTGCFHRVRASVWCLLHR